LFPDFLQEAVAQEALPVRARDVARPDGPRPFRGLDVPQDFEGLREFFRGSGHGRFSSGFVLPLSDCVALYLYYCAVLLLSYYVVPLLSYYVETGLDSTRLEVRPRTPLQIS
jgi:hypothetical protein